MRTKSHTYTHGGGGTGGRSTVGENRSGSFFSFLALSVSVQEEALGMGRKANQRSDRQIVQKYDYARGEKMGRDLIKRAASEQEFNLASSPPATPGL